MSTKRCSLINAKYGKFSLPSAWVMVSPMLRVILSILLSGNLPSACSPLHVREYYKGVQTGWQGLDTVKWRYFNLVLMGGRRGSGFTQRCLWEVVPCFAVLGSILGGGQVHL